MKTNRIQILCRILKTDLVYEASDGTLTAFFDILSQSPLFQSDGLRRILREGCEMQISMSITAILQELRRAKDTCTWDPCAITN